MDDETPLPLGKDAARLLRERRSLLRFPSQMQVGCWTGKGKTGIEWRALVQDLSPQGARLEIGRAFSPGTVLTLCLQKAGPDAGTLNVQAVVKHVRSSSAGWVHGCQFTQTLSDADFQSLVQ